MRLGKRLVGKTAERERYIYKFIYKPRREWRGEEMKDKIVKG